MIRCRPKGICSWDFTLEGEGHRATLEFNWIGEEGFIETDAGAFKVEKHGMTSGRWTMDYGLSAQKTSPFTRTFEVSSPIGDLVLSAVSMASRSMRVERDGELIASIATAHLFTRRATIETHRRDLDFTTLAFLFWLTVLTWRRAQQNNS